MAAHIVISGFEIRHGSIVVRNSDYTWIEDNHLHDPPHQPRQQRHGDASVAGAFVRNNHRTTRTPDDPDASGGWSQPARDSYDFSTTGASAAFRDIYVGYSSETQNRSSSYSNDIHNAGASSSKTPGRW
jgi:hypothetical protein